MTQKITEKKIQEKILEYRVLEERMNQLFQQRALFMSKLQELEITKETLKEISKVGEKKILVAIGSMTYANAKLLGSDKVLVEIGANVALEKSIPEAEKILEKRKQNLESALKRLGEEIERTTQLMQSLQTELQKLGVGKA